MLFLLPCQLNLQLKSIQMDKTRRLCDLRLAITGLHPVTNLHHRSYIHALLHFKHFFLTFNAFKATKYDYFAAAL